MTGELYDKDIIAWSEQQARLLAAHDPNIDWEHLAEELAGMGSNERSALQSFLTIILIHLIKLEHSPKADPRRLWMDSIVSHRVQASAKLETAPALKQRLSLQKAWRDAARRAIKQLDQYGETIAEPLPERCPYTLEQVLDDDFVPENRFGLKS